MSFFYVASPYSHKDPEVENERVRKVMARVAHMTINHKLIVYSPILHWHEIARCYALPGDHVTWRPHNTMMIRYSRGVIVSQIPGWEISEGIQDDKAIARNLGKPIWFDDETQLKSLADTFGEPGGPTTMR